VIQQRPAALNAAIVICVLGSLGNVAPVAGPIPRPIVYAGAALALAGLIGAFGLWRVQRWGALVSTVVLALSALLAAPGIVFGPILALEAIASAVVAFDVAGIVLILLPASRRAYGFRPTPPPSSEPAVPHR
jgi:multisubunit Na+/H+ antiporter MnhF subunit